MKTVTSRVVYENPWLTLREDQVEREDGSRGIYSVIDKPDFALVVPMPGLDGITATARIVAALACRVIILTTFETDEYVFSALRAGASGFLTKEVEPRELRKAIAAVASGGHCSHPA